MGIRYQLLLALGMAWGVATSHAQAVRPITIVVPTAPGGGNDAMARTIGQKMSALLNRPVIVDNKAGANGALAAEHVVKSAPDGNTLMFGYIATHAMNPALQKLRYDPVRDFEPVGRVGYSPTIMVLHPAMKPRDVKDLVRMIKERPEAFSFASAGNGTAPHFTAELFKLATQTQLLHVPYKGSSPAIMDTIAGQTHMMFPSLFAALPYVKSGKLQAMAIAGSRRSPVLPQVPTLKELGVEGVDVDQWYGFFAPAKTPKEVIVRLNQALNTALADPEIVKRIESQGADVEPSTPEQLGELVRTDLAKWRGVVQRARLEAD
ncbi:MAG: tripartite tricarboxylate transporter substrate binding protein [Burkholderiales bacterium]|nr:tripartite tricarboxylate transporter substrate binding protein [Burkholderiales bacterium]MCZ8293709.1 tripartite tricarboxylate transporter substrate binding protein [Hylemonella sp.]